VCALGCWTEKEKPSRVLEWTNAMCCERTRRTPLFRGRGRAIWLRLRGRMFGLHSQARARSFTAFSSINSKLNSNESSNPNLSENGNRPDGKDDTLVVPCETRHVHARERQECRPYELPKFAFSDAVLLHSRAGVLKRRLHRLRRRNKTGQDRSSPHD